MTRSSRLGLVLAFAAVVAVGCGEDNTVGSGVETEGLGGNAGTRLGETTTTEKAAEARSETTVTTAKPSAATTAKPPPTTAAQTAAITITITNTAYDPRQAAVRKGSIVKWVNNDTKPRRLVEPNGVFTSPTIPPGGSWEYKADQTGKFDYADPEVPFAQGTLIVG